MKGRVTRLFVGPFLDALAQIMHRGRFDEIERFFQYHRSFKYPLAGEFSFLTRLARGMNIACDWGLEVSTLSEVYHRVSPRRLPRSIWPTITSISSRPCPRATPAMGCNAWWWTSRSST